MVRIRIGISGNFIFINRVASIPFTNGISISMTIIFGINLSAMFVAFLASANAPIHSKFTDDDNSN